MTNWKSKTIRITKSWANWMTVFAVLLLLLFLLRFEAVAKAVGPAIGMTPEKVQEWSGHALLLIFGIIFLKVGLAFSVIPWVGIPFVVVGLGMLLYEVWSLYRIFNPPSGIPSGKEE